MKFIPLKVKSAKPLPLEENDYVSSENFYIKIDDDNLNNFEEIWNKKNDGKKKEKVGKKRLTESKKLLKISTKDLTENINLNECDNNIANEMMISDNIDQLKKQKKAIKEKKEIEAKELFKDERDKKVNKNREKRKINISNKKIDEDDKSENKIETNIREIEDEKNLTEEKENNTKSIRNISKNKKQKLEEKTESEILTEKNLMDNAKSVLSIPAVATLNVPFSTVRTATPYALYCIDEKIKMKETDENYENYTTGEIIKILSKSWKTLSANVKQEWIINSNLLQTNKKDNFPLDIDQLIDTSDDNKNEKIIINHNEKNDDNQRPSKIQNSTPNDGKKLILESKRNKKEIIIIEKIISHNDKKLKTEKVVDDVEEEEEDLDLFESATAKKGKSNSKSKSKLKPDNKRKNMEQKNSSNCPPKKLIK